MSAPLAIDVLVTTYRRAADVARLLRNLEAQAHAPFRVQLFDGSPDDETAQVVAAHRAARGEGGYVLLYHRTPSGMTRQRNIAVDHAGGDVSVFLDDDVELAPDYLVQVARVFAADAAGEIAGLNGYDLEDDGRIGRKKALYRALGLLPRVGNHRYLPWGHGTPAQEGGAFRGVRDCDMLIGHDMAWRTPILKELRFAPFFAQYPTYVLYDDTDLSLRARRRYRLVQCGDARLRHYTSPAARPPGYHYGFQTVFNAHRNWRTFVPRPRARDRLRFWAWETLNALAIAARALRDPRQWSAVHGMLAGAVATARGVPDYERWVRSRAGRAALARQATPVPLIGDAT